MTAMGEDATSRVLGAGTLGGATTGTASGGVRAAGLMAGASTSGPMGGTAPSTTATGGTTAFALAGGGQSAPTTQGGAGAVVAVPNGSIGRVGLLGMDAYTKAEADQKFVDTGAAGDTMQGLLTTPFGPLQTSAAEGNTLTWEPDGLFVPTPPERGTLTYRYSSNTTMADPGAGFLRANGAAGAGISELAFDVLTDGTTDASVLLRAVRANDHLYLQDQDDSAHWVRFLAEGPAVDEAGWFRLPVVFLDGSGSALGNNHRIDVGFTLSPPTSPSEEQDYARLVIATSAPPGPTPPSDAFWFNPTEEA